MIPGACRTDLDPGPDLLNANALPGQATKRKRPLAGAFATSGRFSLASGQGSPCPAYPFAAHLTEQQSLPPPGSRLSASLADDLRSCWRPGRSHTDASPRLQYPQVAPPAGPTLFCSPALIQLQSVQSLKFTYVSPGPQGGSHAVTRSTLIMGVIKSGYQRLPPPP